MMTRFQRGLICFVPRNVVSLKLKSSFTKSLESADPVASIRCQRRYVFQSSIDVDVNAVFTALKKSG